MELNSLHGFFLWSIEEWFILGSRMILSFESKYVVKKGVGTNMKVELFVFWSLLWMVKRRGIVRLQFMGDSQDIIDWEKYATGLNILALEQWLK